MVSNEERKSGRKRICQARNRRCRHCQYFHNILPSQSQHRPIPCVPFGTDTQFLNVLSLSLRILVPLWPIAATILDFNMGIPGKEKFHMKPSMFITLLFAITSLGVLPPHGSAQSTVEARASSSIADDSAPPIIRHAQPDPAYKRPTEKMRLQTYLFDAFGPYPIVGAA